jgi:hypothetical protein
MRPLLQAIMGPDMVRERWPETDAGAWIQPEPSPPAWNFEPFASQDPLGTPNFHGQARVVPQSGDLPTAMAPAEARQLDDVVGLPFLFRCAAWNLALRRPMLPEFAAGPALGYAEGLSHMADASATARRAGRSPRAA